jgi:hypothetical protein
MSRTACVEDRTKTVILNNSCLILLLNEKEVEGCVYTQTCEYELYHDLRRDAHARASWPAVSQIWSLIVFWFTCGGHPDVCSPPLALGRQRAVLERIPAV